jgi:hypothetical protein
MIARITRFAFFDSSGCTSSLNSEAAKETDYGKQIPS